MGFHRYVATFMIGLSACGGGDNGGGGGGPNPNTVLVKSSSSGDNQTGTVANPLANPLCARVTENGANKSGIDITWATSGGGSMNPTTTTSAGDGTACSTLTLGQTAGSQNATATATGASGSPLTYNATANAGPATTFGKNGGGGDGQQGAINTQLPEPVSVLATDQFGNGVPAVGVTWAVTSGDATLNPLISNTNSDGISASTVTLGGTAGPIVITASSAVTGSPQTFNVASVIPPPAPGAITITVQNPGSFTPSVDTVAVGGTVTWTWAAGAFQHSVTSTGNTSFVSDPAGLEDAPHSYGPITFNTPGTYFYYCTNHGSAGNPPSGMSGTIVVQ